MTSKSETKRVNVMKGEAMDAGVFDEQAAREKLEEIIQRTWREFIESDEPKDPKSNPQNFIWNRTIPMEMAKWQHEKDRARIAELELENAKLAGLLLEPTVRGVGFDWIVRARKLLTDRATRALGGECQ